MKEAQFTGFDQVYFIGIGGIGMSALARYFNFIGWKVGGYDKTPSPLTENLIAEGIEIHYEDLGPVIPEIFRDKTKTLVVYTPAIPKNLGELLFFQSEGFKLLKRAEVLGLISLQTKALGVAGTHGKTTTSTLLAHILQQSHVKANAFLGGISSNNNSNLIIEEGAEYTVIEADEFDKSFLKLSPFASIITSTDSDHLDIYGSDEKFLEGFQEYANLIRENGFLIIKKGISLDSPATKITYSLDDHSADFYADKLRYEDGKFLFDVHTKDFEWTAVEVGIPGIHNTENALACIALCLKLGLTEEEIRNGLSSFKGVKRRFEYYLKHPDLVYIDDYAHHPTEIRAIHQSLRMLYPDKKILAIFQPHLFSRTRDFLTGFIEELSEFDETILLPIYPAREEPIPGISSENISEKLTNKSHHFTVSETLEFLKNFKEGVVLTIGAGDIDRIVLPVYEQLRQNMS